MANPLSIQVSYLVSEKLKMNQAVNTR